MREMIYTRMRFFLILLIILLFFSILYAYHVRWEKIYVQTRKPLIHENKYGKKTIIDKKNVTYNTTNSIFHCHFDFENVYSKLNENKVYHIQCYGYNIPLIGLHPNILRVK